MVDLFFDMVFLLFVRRSHSTNLDHPSPDHPSSNWSKKDMYTASSVLAFTLTFLGVATLLDNSFSQASKASDLSDHSQHIANDLNYYLQHGQFPDHSYLHDTTLFDYLIDHNIFKYDPLPGLVRSGDVTEYHLHLKHETRASVKEKLQAMMDKESQQADYHTHRSDFFWHIAILVGFVGIATTLFLGYKSNQGDQSELAQSTQAFDWWCDVNDSAPSYGSVEMHRRGLDL